MIGCSSEGKEAHLHVCAFVSCMWWRCAGAVHNLHEAGGRAVALPRPQVIRLLYGSAAAAGCQPVIALHLLPFIAATLLRTTACSK
jgi:hypothetical protein